MTNNPVEFPPIADLFDAVIEKEIQTYPCWANRLSSIGHCKRKQFYNRTQWQDALPVEVGLQRIFELGKLWEKYIFEYYLTRQPGVDIRRSQEPVAYQKYKLSGKPDWILRWNETLYVVDAKSFNPNTWSNFNTMQDFMESGQHYYRAYVEQLQGYMLLAEIPQGFLWLGNKATMEMKIIPMELDYGIAEKVIQTAEEINKAVDSNTPPDRIPYGKECEGCQFRHICKPPKPHEIIYDMTSPEVVELVEAWHQAKEAKSGYEDLNEKLNEVCGGVEMAVCGRFIITGKKRKDGVWLKKIIPACEVEADEA